MNGAAPELRREKRSKKAEFSDREGFFRTSDGLKLAYRVGGNPKGPPVLFCYGLVCSSFHFKYQWEALKQECRLLLLDYRGHHISENPKAVTTLTFSRMTQDLREFLAHEKVTQSVAVVGHSMGVNIALEFFFRFPEKVSALVLIAGAAAFPAKNKTELKRVAFAHSALRVLDGLFPATADQFWRLQSRIPGVERFAGLLGFNPKLSRAEDIKGVIENMSGFRPNVFFQLLGEYIRLDHTKLLGKIDVPSLIIGGEKDKMVPWSFQKELHARIPESELFCVKEGSHVPQFDRPDEVNRVLKSFFRTLRA